MESISSASPWPIHLSSHLLWGSFPNINCFFQGPGTHIPYQLPYLYPDFYTSLPETVTNWLGTISLWLIHVDYCFSCCIPQVLRRIILYNPLHYIAPCTFYSFIHSFGHFYSAPSSPLLLRGAPDYNTDTVSEFHAEAHRQLQVKDLPKVPTWRLERESNPRPSG